MRFKDNTFVWLSNAGNAVVSSVLKEPEATAYGVWQLKIPKPEIKLAIDNLKLSLDNNKKKDNVAIFGDDKKIFLYVTKQGDASG